MRKCIFSLSIILGLIISSCSNQSNDSKFNLKINLNDGADNTLYLSKREGGAMVNIDSITLVNGIGEINGNIGLPEFYYIVVKNTKIYFPIFIEAGDIVLNADMNNPQNPLVAGSLTHEKYLTYNDSVGVFDVKASELYNKYGEARKVNDTILMKQIENEYYGIDSLKTNYLVDFVSDNPDNIVSAFLLINNTYKFELPQLDSMINTLESEIDSSIYVKKLHNYVNTLKKSAVGQPFIDFALNDPTGNKVALSSVVGDGKYVLVDFWASWCSPCRAENPNVVEAFNKYHEKGFDVFGVSFDKDHEKWVDAITDDELAWTQVSDLKYWDCEAGKLYGIQSIPQNIMISPEGIIIEKNLRGEDLQNKLAEIFE